MTEIIEINNEEVFESFDDIMNKNNSFSHSSDLESINTYIFYIDNDEIANYKKYQIKIDNNTITKKELLAIVLNNNKYYSKKYDLVGIYKYCFNLTKENLKSFCINQNEYNFVEKYNKIQDIPYNKTIDLFQSNNSLILIFSRNSKKQNVSTSETNEIKSEKSDNKKNKTQKQVRFNLKQSNKTLKKTT